MKKQEILIVDDESINLSVLKKLLSPYFLVRACRSGESALQVIMDAKPDLILLDILMPGMDGYETLSRMRKDPRNDDIPVIFVSALDSGVDEEKGFQLGAVDYIAKPFSPAIVVERVRVHLELKQSRDRLKNQNQWLEKEVNRRMQENQFIQDVTLNIITQLAETRDADTGNHILRTKSYVQILIKRLMQNPKFAVSLKDASISNIVKASSLHDVGKIGIPDEILLKPGKLTNEEFEKMKKHCQIGENAIRIAIEQASVFGNKKADTPNTKSLDFLKEAQIIAACHHERWDGKGYPKGLKGAEIPLSARLMAVADVFDALTTTRVYKEPWSFNRAAAYICKQNGLRFDPDVVEAFEAELDSFKIILRLMAD